MQLQKIFEFRVPTIDWKLNPFTKRSPENASVAALYSSRLNTLVTPEMLAERKCETGKGVGGLTRSFLDKGQAYWYILKKQNSSTLLSNAVSRCV
jgi:hypothetical protein